MEVMFYCLLALALVTALLFVIFSNGQKNFLSLSLKAVASFCFTLLAMGALLTTVASLPVWLFVLGFVASCFGDVVLALPDMPEMQNRATIITLIGGLCFAVAHIFYISAMIVAFGFAWWTILIAIALGIIFCYGNKFVGKLNYGKLSAGMPIYSIFVSLVVAISIMAFIGGTSLPGAIMLLVGFVLFWLSDIVLMNIYFGNKPEKKTKLYYFNLAFYYIGQILIACSLWFLF